MVKVSDEDELKDALGIDSWRNLSRDKIVKFAAMMPDMDKELAGKIIAKFPEFKAFALDALSGIEKLHNSSVDRNAVSQDRVSDAFHETREILKSELERDDLTPAERLAIIEKIGATADREFEKDSENKKFLEGLFNKGTAVAGGALVLGVVFVGGKFFADGRTGSNSS